MTVELSSLTMEYVRVAVSATESGRQVDPTVDVVLMAFPARGVVPSSWQSASWERGNGVFYARQLIGPGSSVVLAPGAYDVWVKVTDTPEIAVRNAGLLTIT